MLRSIVIAIPGIDINLGTVLCSPGPAWTSATRYVCSEGPFTRRAESTGVSCVLDARTVTWSSSEIFLVFEVVPQMCSCARVEMKHDSDDESETPDVS
jgi:hypothetical protein